MMFELKELFKQYKRAYEAISTATHYTSGYLCWGSACDSSNDKDFRMKYVLEAQKQFINEHYDEILNRAAKMLDNEIENFKKDIK